MAALYPEKVCDKVIVTRRKLHSEFHTDVITLDNNERIKYKLLSLTYKVLTTSQPDDLHNLISVQSSGRTRSSSVVTLARPSVSSSLQITNCSFKYASTSPVESAPFFIPSTSLCSPHPAHITSSQSSPSFSPSVTPSTFHSRLKTHPFHKAFPP